MKPFYYINTYNTLSISTTGNYCALNCKHCNKHYLHHMKTFEDVFKNKNNFKNYTSFLISGGSNKKGYVPFFKHIKRIEKLKKAGEKINLHTGVLSPEYFKYLYIADSVSIDIIGDDQTINFVYNLNKKSKDYFKYFETLLRFKLNNNLKFKIVPHITIGLNGGKNSGEKKAIKFLSQFSKGDPNNTIETVVFLILIPTKNTYFEATNPPKFNFVKDIFKTAYELFYNSNTNLFLGCMRPKGKYRKEIDKIAVETGINGVVNPTFDKAFVKKFIDTKFSKIIYINECCALV